MDVIAAIHGRRSVRSYDPKPVERELIERVIEDAAQAPPPFRGQVPWAFNVLQGVERIVCFHSANSIAVVPRSRHRAMASPASYFHSVSPLAPSAKRMSTYSSKSIGRSRTPVSRIRLTMSSKSLRRDQARSCMRRRIHTMP